jgi:hypothetical protein
VSFDVAGKIGDKLCVSVDKISGMRYIPILLPGYTQGIQAP